MRQKIRLPVCLIAGPAALTLLFFGSAAAQKQNPIPTQAGGMRGSEIDLTLLSSSPKLYVSVREPNGLPVTENATVKLSCPLSNVDVSGPTNDTALAEFANIPAGDVKCGETLRPEPVGWRLRGKDALPDGLAMRCIRK